MPSSRRDAAAGAWRRGRLWRERVGDDGVVGAALAAALAAPPLPQRKLLRVVCIFFVV